MIIQVEKSSDTSEPQFWVRTKSIWLTVIVILAVIALDQISKSIILGTVSPGNKLTVIPGVHLVNVRNSGLAFGTLRGAGSVVTIVLTTIVSLLIVVYFAKHRFEPLLWLPTGLLLGGALGNLTDRIIHSGTVIDFISLPHWPPFNFADTAVTLGVIALFFVLIRNDRRRT